MNITTRWAAILAGGSGTRLRAFTRDLSGDERPKQFCRLLGPDTLVGATASRLSTLVEPRHTLYVVTREHEPYYAEALGHVDPLLLLEQPANRGTALAIAWAAFRVRRAQPDGILGLFPSDHHYQSEATFRRAVDAAYLSAAHDPRRVFMLGAEADRPESDYGWIEAGAVLTGGSGRVHPRRVAAFVEKPTPTQAAELLRRRGLWNTFVLVGHVQAFYALIEAARPELAWQMDEVIARGDREELRSLYASSQPTDFSRDILSARPDRLGVIPLVRSGWTDLGRPSRVIEVMTLHCRPNLVEHERTA